MADLLKMDPARIARLRDPARYDLVDPERVLDVVAPHGSGPIVDVGAGVGFVTLPFARRFPDRRIVAADVQPEMLALLAEAAAEEGLANVETAPMPGPASLPLADGAASLLVMLQVHHELDDAIALLKECRRVLAPGAAVASVDGTPVGASSARRAPAARIAAALVAAGFAAVATHDLYPQHAPVVANARRP
ncbi:MAG: class I SAM-dependent methyltransferase [Alphaproteobacteria bacterium]